MPALPDNASNHLQRPGFREFAFQVLGADLFFGQLAVRTGSCHDFVQGGAKGEDIAFDGEGWPGVSMTGCYCDKQGRTVQQGPSKVHQLGIETLIQEYVLGCQVSVNDTHHMDKSESFGELSGTTKLLPDCCIVHVCPKEGSEVVIQCIFKADARFVQSVIM